MLPLQINDSLFFWHKGTVYGTWGLGCGDGYTDELREAYINWCLGKKCDGAIMNLANEDYVTLFQGGVFMGAPDMGKVNTLIRFSKRIHDAGGKVVYCFFDGKSGNPKYPYHNQLNKWESFIQAVCQTLNPYASAYLFACESNEFMQAQEVQMWISVIKKYAGLIPVGSHEQWNPHTREFCGGDFCCYETHNHPKDGDSVSVDDLVAEVQHIQSHLPPGFPVWVSEFNWSDSQRCREQARALAALPGVVGVGAPM